MNTDYVAYHRHLEERLAQLGQKIPSPMSGFARLHKKAVEEGALSAKTKELMALAISIAVRCEGCISYHVHDAVEAGATRQELLETIGIALMMGVVPARSTLPMPWMPLISSCLRMCRNERIWLS